MKYLFVTSDKFPCERVDVRVLLSEEMSARGHEIDWLMQSDPPLARSTAQPFGNGHAFVGASYGGQSRLAKAIRQVQGLLHDFRVLGLARRNRFMGRWLRHGEGYPDWIVRLFDRTHARWNDKPVHEAVVVDGSVGALKGDLLHESERGLTDYLEKQNRYTTIQAQTLHARGKRVSAVRLVFSPFFRFIKFYFLRLGFLDGVPGLVHIAIGCFNSFAKYAKLRALQKAAR